MNGKLDEQIRDLAYHMWESAGHEYGRALDYWLISEQMVREMALLTAKWARSSLAMGAGGDAPTSQEVSDRYLNYVRDLAYAMWESADKHVGWTMDFWLSAERHVRTMMVAAARTAGSTVGADKTVSQAFEAFSADAYLERIRRTAYSMWEAAGRQYGRSLDFWLAAERQVLQSMSAPPPAGAPAASLAPSVPAPAEPVPPPPQPKAAAAAEPAPAPKPRRKASARAPKSAKK